MLTDERGDPEFIGFPGLFRAKKKKTFLICDERRHKLCTSRTGALLPELIGKLIGIDEAISV
jgi:hypothetical protein